MLQHIALLAGFVAAAIAVIAFVEFVDDDLWPF